MWRGIIGHDRIVERFGRAVARGRLASTFLFVGPSGIGKRTLARELAHVLLCPHRAAGGLVPCDRCSSCRQFQSGMHPDLHEISLPAGASKIPLDSLIGSRENRMREGLCYQISLKPFLGVRKIAIIQDADYFNLEGANSLLKTLEQPPGNSIIILISHSLDRQLITIRSRSQILRFEPLQDKEVGAILTERKLIDDPVRAAKLASHSGGSVQQALELAGDDMLNFRAQFFQSLAIRPLRNVPLSKQMAEFIDAAGKEAPPRRTRLKWLMACAAEFYRELARAICGAEPSSDELLKITIQAALTFKGWELDSVLAAAELCLDSTERVDRNANQALIIEAWLDELSRMLTPPPALVVK